MRFPRIGTRWVLAGTLFISATGMVAQEQGFPLRPGGWEVTSKTAGLSEPIVLQQCLTNETWAKGLTQVPSCKIQELSVNSKGMHYSLDCQMKTIRMKGQVDFTFDGMEHMTGKSTMTMVSADGKTTTSQVDSDYRWKAAACTAPNAGKKAKGPR